MNDSLILVLLVAADVFALAALYFSYRASRARGGTGSPDAAVHQIEMLDKLERERAERAGEAQARTEQRLDETRREVDAKLAEIRAVTNDKLTETLARQSGELRDHLGKFDERFGGFQTQIKGFQDQMTTQLGEIRTTVDKQLSHIREDNEKQLERMRATVDEKLTKTLNDRLSTSFELVNKQLESVNKGLGDMQSLASGVGDLSRVLSNVKTRGILGEVQLKGILTDILAPNQYEENVATKPGSNDRVEFAVKIPTEDGSTILLPIDAKFPGDAYGHLQEALESGDRAAIAATRKTLVARINAEAKDIHDKYLSTPDTTSFGIMFLPFEGLYAEVVNQPGLIEGLQRSYRVNVAGPSTMAALLNSLSMSYQSFAIQKKADEIQRVLSAVKAEFPKYQKELEKAQKQIETAGKTVSGIITTRTNVIERKLRDVTALEDGEQAAELLGTDGPLLVEGDGSED